MTSSQYSADLFLDWVRLVAMFLEDGKIVVVDYDTKGRRHKGGDLVMLEQDGSEEEAFQQNVESEQQHQKPERIAVVLGWGENETDAIEDSKTYMRRIAKWHGHDGEVELNIYGYDLSQSQLFQDIVKDDKEDTSGSSIGTEEVDVVNL